MRQLIPLATSAVTLWGMWVVGNKSWKGWAIGLGNQALWLLFIVTFDAWGLLPLSIALIFTYARNLIRWRRDEALIVDAEILDIGSPLGYPRIVDGQYIARPPE